jgi:hypothetical protein
MSSVDNAYVFYSLVEILYVCHCCFLQLLRSFQESCAEAR